MSLLVFVFVFVFDSVFFCQLLEWQCQSVADCHIYFAETNLATSFCWLPRTTPKLFPDIHNCFSQIQVQLQIQIQLQLQLQMQIQILEPENSRFLLSNVSPSEFLWWRELIFNKETPGFVESQGALLKETI